MDKKLKRYQLEVNKNTNDLIEYLIKETKLETKKDLFLNALVLMQWIIDKKKKGNVIAAFQEDEDSYIELTSPIFLNIKQNIKQKTIKPQKKC